MIVGQQFGRRQDGQGYTGHVQDTPPNGATKGCGGINIGADN